MFDLPQHVKIERFTESENPTSPLRSGDDVGATSDRAELKPRQALGLRCDRQRLVFIRLRRVHTSDLKACTLNMHSHL